jgi:hypothetical protein
LKHPAVRAVYFIQTNDGFASKNFENFSEFGLQTKMDTWLTINHFMRIARLTLQFYHRPGVEMEA